MIKLKSSFNKSWGELIYRKFVAAFFNEWIFSGEKLAQEKCELFLQISLLTQCTSLCQAPFC
jgi:hypothetical protein